MRLGRDEAAEQQVCDQIATPMAAADCASGVKTGVATCRYQWSMALSPRSCTLNLGNANLGNVEPGRVPISGFASAQAFQVAYALGTGSFELSCHGADQRLGDDEEGGRRIPSRRHGGAPGNHMAGEAGNR